MTFDRHPGEPRWAYHRRMMAELRRTLRAERTDTICRCGVPIRHDPVHGWVHTASIAHRAEPR